MSVEERDGAIGGETTIDLVAGRHPSGEWIMERLLVSPQAQAATYQLLKSPVFVRGIARGDLVQQLDQPRGAFTVLQHSGNLCIRVLSRQGFDTPQYSTIEQSLTADIEKLGGDLDIRESRVLVYSIHVSCGFQSIEKILDQRLAGHDDIAWYYGNVYDPETGEPLNWWQGILSQA